MSFLADGWPTSLSNRRVTKVKPWGCPISRVLCEKWGPSTFTLRTPNIQGKICPPSKAPPFENHERWGTPRLKIEVILFGFILSAGNVGHPPMELADMLRAGCSAAKVEGEHTS